MLVDLRNDFYTVIKGALIMSDNRPDVNQQRLIEDDARRASSRPNTRRVPIDHAAMTARDIQRLAGPVPRPVPGEIASGQRQEQPSRNPAPDLQEQSAAARVLRGLGGPIELFQKPVIIGEQDLLNGMSLTASE